MEPRRNGVGSSSRNPNVASMMPVSVSYAAFAATRLCCPSSSRSASTLALMPITFRSNARSARGACQICRSCRSSRNRSASIIATRFRYPSGRDRSGSDISSAIRRSRTRFSAPDSVSSASPDFAKPIAKAPSSLRTTDTLGRTISK